LYSKACCPVPHSNISLSECAGVFRGSAWRSISILSSLLFYWIISLTLFTCISHTSKHTFLQSSSAMSTLTLPSTIRAWQYTSVAGGLEANLKLNTIPLPKPKSTQHLIRIIAVALNPVDYKPVEIPVLDRIIAPRIATPGIDFAGVLIKPATGSSLKPGQFVFGAPGTSPIAGGALSEYIVADTVGTAAIPEGVDPIDASTITVAGLSAYQSIVPHVKEGDNIFINGGSGGTGVFGIQIAKALGCHVTTSCSGPNVELCRSLGADEVLNYRERNLVDQLKERKVMFDHVVDNIGTDSELYWQSQEFMKKEALYVMVGGGPSWQHIGNGLKRGLGFGQRKYTGFFANPNVKDLEAIANWVKEGKVKAVIDSKFKFEETRQAFERLKTSRAKGKVVIDVARGGYEKW
jgi:NADPH:quinone reductase-like Zn-dependent oxidoreductase